MSRVSRGISVVVYFLLYLMNFSLERTSSSRFSFRIVRKTKVEKLQSIDENEFYGIVSSQAAMREKEIYGGKPAKRGANYDMNGEKRWRKLFSKRNKVAPEVHVEAWTETSANKTVNMDSAGSYSSVKAQTKDGKIIMKRSLQHWNTKTGKEIKTEEKQTPAFSSDNYLTMFLNDLSPPTTDNFVTCQSNGLPCDPSFVEVDAEDVPSTSSGVTSHVTLNLRKGEAWAEEVKLKDKKSALTKFFSRFNKRVKTTKVKRIRL